MRTTTVGCTIRAMAMAAFTWLACGLAGAQTYYLLMDTNRVPYPMDPNTNAAKLEVGPGIYLEDDRTNGSYMDNRLLGEAYDLAWKLATNKIDVYPHMLLPRQAAILVPVHVHTNVYLYPNASNLLWSVSELEKLQPGITTNLKPWQLTAPPVDEGVKRAVRLPHWIKYGSPTYEADLEHWKATNFTSHPNPEYTFSFVQWYSADFIPGVAPTPAAYAQLGESNAISAGHYNPSRLGINNGQVQTNGARWVYYEHPSAGTPIPVDLFESATFAFDLLYPNIVAIETLPWPAARVHFWGQFDNGTTFDATNTIWVNEGFRGRGGNVTLDASEEWRMASVTINPTYDTPPANPEFLRVLPSPYGEPIIWPDPNPPTWPRPPGAIMNIRAGPGNAPMVVFATSELGGGNWQEETNFVTDADGYFTLTVGSTNMMRFYMLFEDCR